MIDFPIIKSGGMTIPWSVAEQAYLGYIKKYGDCQSLKMLADRGGFGVSEMDEFHPEWREHIKLKALAASRLELLRRCSEFLSLGPRFTPHIWADIELFQKELAKELADAKS